MVFADQVKVGDTIHASYHIPPNDTLVCAWVKVKEIKHHTDTTVTLLSWVIDNEGELVRWVEYPLDAPIVYGVPE